MDFDNIEDIRAYFADDEFARKCLGATIDDYDFETGIATVSMEIDDRHHNAQGFVMGGVFFSLADYALAVASNVNQPPLGLDQFQHRPHAPRQGQQAQGRRPSRQARS